MFGSVSSQTTLQDGIPLCGFHCCHHSYSFPTPTVPAQEWLVERIADISWPHCLGCLVVGCLFHSGCSLECIHMCSKDLPTDPSMCLYPCP